MNKTVLPGKYSGTILIPSSKSDGQRAIIAAGLAKGTSTLFNLGNSHDEQAALATMQQLGAQFTVHADKTVLVQGIQHFPQQATVNLGESGLSLRLLSCICAAHAGNFTIQGTGSALQRPMRFFETYLPQFGASVQSNNTFLPLEISGPMHGSTTTIDGSQSSQYISGLMMSLPLLAEESRVSVANLKSKPYLQMTVETLSHFGVRIDHHDWQDFVIAPKQQYLPCSYTIEGDWSSASFWIVASALGQAIAVQGLKLASLQADKGILPILSSANCVIHYENGIQIDGSKRTSFVADLTDSPDLFPALAVFAANTPGISTLKGVHRLEHKESNRGIVLKNEMGKLGVVIQLNGDEMIIHGKSTINGGTVHANNDHRIAMCFAILGMFTATPITVENAESVGKSYLDFWEDLAHLTHE